MKKKKSTRRVTPAGLRSKIDRLDRDLVKLLNQRASLAIRLTKVREQQGEDTHDAGRLDDVLTNVGELNSGPLDERCVRAIFRELVSGTRALARGTRIAYLGPAYSYTHLASMQHFGSSVELVAVGTIPAVFEEVNRKHVDFGVVPLENSTDGRVADTLDMFTRLSVRIRAEVQLRIHHCLLAKCPYSEVQEIYSKPQALSQCRNWIAKHMPAARAVEVTSTSTAAQLAADKQGASAIASREAGVHYGLDVLAENIEDNQANITRFAVIAHEGGARTGNDKTALMFEIEHRPGALADATAIFKRNKLNMTWIESFPIARPEGGYMFFVEVTGHEREAKLKRAIAALERKAVRLEVLGSYPVAEPLD